MNKLTKILPLGFVGVLLLSACTNPFSKSDVSHPISTPDGAPVETRVPNEVTTEVSVVEDKMAQDESAAAELAYFSRYGTGLKCSQLVSDLARKECEVQMNDVVGSMLEREIVSTFDINRCKELPGEVGESCQSRLADTGVKGPVSAEELALFAEITRGEFPMAEEGQEPALYPVYKKERCAELKATGYQAYCEKMIAERMERNLFDEIIQSEKSSRCDELKSERMMNDCKSFFGIDVAPEVSDVPPVTMVVEAEGA